MEKADYHRLNRELIRKLRRYERECDLEMVGNVKDDIARLNTPYVYTMAKNLYFTAWARRGMSEPPPDFDTMVADGFFGLAKAIDSYIEMGNNFETYFFPKVWKAIVDGLRFSGRFRYDSLWDPVFDNGKRPREQTIGEDDR